MPEIKIAYILSKFPVFTETFIIREIREIRRRGIDVEVFSLKSAAGDKSKHAEAEELRAGTHYIPFIFSLEVWQSVFYYLVTRPGATLGMLGKIIARNISSPMTLLKSLAVFPKATTIANRLRKMGIRRIHSHWATVPTTASWIVSALNGAEFTFTTHAWDIFKADNMLEEKMAASSGVRTISAFNKQYLLEKFPRISPDKISVIHIGIDVRRFVPHDRSDHKGFVILSIGRLVETKGFQFLLGACDTLRKRNVDFFCRIIYVSDAYDGEIFALYEKLGLKGAVELVSEVPQEKILDYYNSSDCLALPCIVDKSGDRDGIPTVILEALATEMPVVSTEVSGIPEVVINDLSGILIEPESSSGLADALETLHGDPALRDRLGKRGREIVLDEFEISRSVDLLLGIILRDDAGIVSQSAARKEKLASP